MEAVCRCRKISGLGHAHEHNSVMIHKFEDFPPSYRFCQGCILAVLVLATSCTGAYIGRVPSFVKIGFGCMLGALVVASLVVCAYVVVRYPYLSLVQPVDGDYLDRRTTGNTRGLVFVLKLLASAFCIMATVLIPRNGFATPPSIAAYCYFLVMLPFLAFLTFAYRPTVHPTIATYMRATLGVGVILFPVYIPILVVGSIRCRRLLNAARTS
jgi:hypothetical protein